MADTAKKKRDRGPPAAASSLGDVSTTLENDDSSAENVVETRNISRRPVNSNEPNTNGARKKSSKAKSKKRIEATDDSDISIKGKDEELQRVDSLNVLIISSKPLDSNIDAEKKVVLPAFSGRKSVAETTSAVDKVVDTIGKLRSGELVRVRKSDSQLRDEKKLMQSALEAKNVLEAKAAKQQAAMAARDTQLQKLKEDNIHNADLWYAEMKYESGITDAKDSNKNNSDEGSWSSDDAIEKELDVDESVINISVLKNIESVAASMGNEIITDYKTRVAPTSDLSNKYLTGGLDDCIRITQAGEWRALKLLIRNQGDIHLSDAYGKTPLVISAENGFSRCAKILLQNHAKIEATSNLGMTALHFAAGNGHVEIVEMLLQAGANPNVLSKMKETPLAIAVRNNQVDVCQLLLTCDKFDLDPNITGRGNLPLLACAAIWEYVEVAEILLFAGAKVDVRFTHQGEEKWTPLLVAAALANIHLIQKLIKYGADTTLQISTGDRPIDLFKQVKNNIGDPVAVEMGLSLLTSELEHQRSKCKCVIL